MEKTTNNETKLQTFSEYIASFVPLSKYIADYIAEEAKRGNTKVDQHMIQNAINAYDGGAGEIE
jgi:hypothetical protein